MFLDNLTTLPKKQKMKRLYHADWRQDAEEKESVLASLLHRQLLYAVDLLVEIVQEIVL